LSHFTVAFTLLKSWVAEDPTKRRLPGSTQ
jgi:hypothetical protein